MIRGLFWAEKIKIIDPVDPIFNDPCESVVGEQVWERKANLRSPQKARGGLKSYTCVEKRSKFRTSVQHLLNSSKSSSSQLRVREEEWEWDSKNFNGFAWPTIKFFPHPRNLHYVHECTGLIGMDLNARFMQPTIIVKHNQGKSEGFFAFLGKIFVSCIVSIHQPWKVYRVTHHVVQNLPLTSKQKFRFGMAWPDLD